MEKAIPHEQNATEPDILSAQAIDSKIASLLIENPSLTDQEIASQVGVSRQTVNRRRNSTVVQKLVRSVLAIPEFEARRLSAKALRRLEAFLDSDDPRISLRASIAIVQLMRPLTTPEPFALLGKRWDAT